MPDRFDRWMPALANLFAGVFLAVVFFRDGNEVTAAVVLGVLAVVAWRSSPLRRGAHTVPTVLTVSGVLLEPSPDAIRSHLTEGDAPKG